MQNHIFAPKIGFENLETSHSNFVTLEFRTGTPHNPLSIQSHFFNYQYIDNTCNSRVKVSQATVSLGKEVVIFYYAKDEVFFSLFFVSQPRRLPEFSQIFAAYCGICPQSPDSAPATGGGMPSPDVEPGAQAPAHIRDRAMQTVDHRYHSLLTLGAHH
jgi:hypothetical protein